VRRGIVQVIKFTAFFAAGIILLWLAFRNIDISRLAADLKEAKYSWLLFSIFFGVLAYISRARRWVLLIHPLGFKPSLRNSFYSLMTGYLANLALPRVGEITRCVALGKKEKIPVDKLIGTVVVERTIDFLSLLLIMVMLIFTSSEDIGLFLNESILVPMQQKFITIFGVTWLMWGILFLLFLASFSLLIIYRHTLRRFRILAKFFDAGRGIIKGMKTITNLKSKWEFIFHTVFIWINYTLMTWVVVFSLESTSHLTLGDSIFLLVIGGLAMSAPVQSGLGAFHYIISRGLYIVKDIAIEDGLVYALLAHESQLIFIAIVGTISFFIIFRKEPRKEMPSDLLPTFPKIDL
jgi:glycosyltransferase 2 family protein